MGNSIKIIFFFSDTLFLFSYEGSISLVNLTYLDYETTPQYNVTIQVTDQVGLSDTGVLTVDVIDVNEPPVILNLPATVTVQDGTEGGQVIFTVLTFDPDGHSVNYSLQSTPPAGPFSIDSQGTFI